MDFLRQASPLDTEPQINSLAARVNEIVLKFCSTEGGGIEEAKELVDLIAQIQCLGGRCPGNYDANETLRYAYVVAGYCLAEEKYGRPSPEGLDACDYFMEAVRVKWLELRSDNVRQQASKTLEISLI